MKKVTKKNQKVIAKEIDLLELTLRTILQTEVKLKVVQWLVVVNDKKYQVDEEVGSIK